MQLMVCVDAAVPSELIRDSLAVTQGLTDRGHTVACVVGSPVGFVDQAGGWVPQEIYQAPIPAAAPSLVMKRHDGDGLADRLAVVGFDDKQAIITLATAWQRLLDRLRPDVVVGFYCPTVWLVAPAHTPTIAIGNGFALPPVLGTSFPRLSSDLAPLASEDRMLDNANAALGRLGQSAIAALSDIVDRCTSIVYGVPAFDPYLRLRRAQSRGLLGCDAKPVVPPANPRIAAFLDVYCPGVETIILAITAASKIPFDVCVSGATSGMRRFLEQHKHVKLWGNYSSLLERAGSATVLLHHGVQDVAQHCIALGRPQLIIPWTREQHVFDVTVNSMGFTWTKSPATSVDDLTGTFGAVIRDASIAVSAQHHARQLADSGLSNALPEIIAEIEGAGRG